MFRRAAAAFGWLLAAFHGWLFAVQAFAGELAEPALAMRWAAALAVGAGFIALRRAGISIFTGRRAVALWMLVVLLHAPAVADRITNAEPALPEVVTLLTSSPAAAGVLVLVLLLAALAGRRRDARQVASWRLVSDIVFRAWFIPTHAPLAPRPPPAN